MSWSSNLNQHKNADCFAAPGVESFITGHLHDWVSPIPGQHCAFLLIRETFIAHFLCARNCAKHRGYDDNRDVASAVHLLRARQCASCGLGPLEDSGRELCPCPLGSQPDGDPGNPHPGPAGFPLCLQSSGNVWVTHEEMETLETSTKTVSLALGLWPWAWGWD